jgi:hypothetical protein
MIDVMRRPKMNDESREIERIYLLLLTLQTLATSLIWGVNTLFLLDAGLSNFQAFAANACFTAGMVLFEIPTGIIADSYGRRLSYLLGTVTLFASTLLYLDMWKIHAAFWMWGLVSAFLGLGFCLDHACISRPSKSRVSTLHRRYGRAKPSIETPLKLRRVHSWMQKVGEGSHRLHRVPRPMN